MKLFKKRYFSNGLSVLIGKIDAPENTLLSATLLSNDEKEVLSSVSSTKRRKEWLTVRWLIQQFYNDKVWIEYEESGCPVLYPNQQKISISHSGEFVSAIIHSTVEVGIDIQRKSAKITRIAKRFLSETEKEYCTYEDIDRLHIIWCAKEALFKYYNKGNVEFNQNLIISPFDIKKQGTITGHLNFEDFHETILLHYEKINDYYLVYTLYR